SAISSPTSTSISSPKYLTQCSKSPKSARFSPTLARGVADNVLFHPEGMPAISRWLSAATPPEPKPITNLTDPERVAVLNYRNLPPHVFFFLVGRPTPLLRAVPGPSSF